MLVVGWELAAPGALAAGTAAAPVEIDAAGLAALIALYCDARKSGHRFLVANPSPRVSEILRMVGLDEILVSRNAEEPSCFRPHLQETAA